MTFPKALLRLQPKRGFIADTPAHEASEDFWTTVNNVQFRDGFATRLQGERAAYADEIALIAPVEMYHAINSLHTSINWWLIIERSGAVHAIQSGGIIKIDDGLFTPVDAPWLYSSALLNGLPIISNSREPPVYWDASTVLKVLPGWPAGDSCRFIAVLKFHIFAFNITGAGGNFEHLVRWSSATEPGTVPNEWEPSATNDAGDVLLADSPGPILCAYPLGDSLYIYKRSATYQARYVGGQNVYSFRKVQSSSGALTSRSVCDVGGSHFIVADGDIILNDGTTRRSIGESRVKEWLFDQLDPVEFTQLSCTYNRAKDEVIVAFPSTGSTYNDTALVYDLSRDAWGVRSLDQVTHLPVGIVRDSVPENTWINRTEVWTLATDVWAATSATGAVDTLMTLKATEFTQEDFNSGEPLDCLVGRTGLTFGEPERIKFVKRVHVRTQQAFGELFVRVGGQMVANGAINWSTEKKLTGNQQIVNRTALGRFIAVEVRSADGVAWKVTGIDLEAELRGYH